MKTLHIAVITAVAIVTVSSIVGYYLFMPTWIYVEKTSNSNSSDLHVISLSDQDLKNVPTLEHIIGFSDAAYPSGHISPIETSNSEGKNIANLIHANSNGDGTISYKNSTYSIYLTFSYTSPHIQ